MKFITTLALLLASLISGRGANQEKPLLSVEQMSQLIETQIAVSTCGTGTHGGSQSIVTCGTGSHGQPNKA